MDAVGIGAILCVGMLIYLHRLVCKMDEACDRAKVDTTLDDLEEAFHR